MRSRRATLAGTAVVVVLVLVVGLGPALGPTVGPTPVLAAAAQVDPGGRLSLASQTPWVAPGGAFELRIDLAGVRQPEALTLEVSVHEGVSSRSQFAQTLDGRFLGDEVWRLGPTPLVDIELDDAGAVRVAIPIAGDAGGDASSAPGGGPPLVLAEAGVHPVRVVLGDAQAGAEIDGFTTHLVRVRDDDAAALAVAWIQPVAAPPTLAPDGSTRLEPAAHEGLDSVVAALDAAPIPLTVVPGPETLDALAVADPELVDQLARSLTGRQVVAGPYVDVDIAALLAAGLGDVLSAQRERGTAVVANVAGPADARTLVANRPLDAVALAGVAEVERLVLPEAALAPLDRPLTLANPFLVADANGRLLEAAAVDPQLQSHFAQVDPVLGAHHLLADLAVLAYDAPGLTRGVVVQPPPGWAPAPDLLATALPALASGPVVRPVVLDQLFATVPPAPAAGGDGPLVRTLQPQPPPPVVDPEGLRRLRGDLASFATMVDPPDPALDLARRLALVSSASRWAPPQRQAYLDGAGSVIEARLGAVRILSEGSFRLTSRQATIPLTLVNDLEVEVDVALALESDKLDFLDSQPSTSGRVVIPLELGPGSTPVMVPVEARTSGDFPLLIDLRSPDGRLGIATTRLTVRSTSLSGVGILASAGAGLFLCVWWGRHWRSVRRDRRLIEPDPSA